MPDEDILGYEMELYSEEELALMPPSVLDRDFRSRSVPSEAWLDPGEVSWVPHFAKLAEGHAEVRNSRLLVTERGCELRMHCVKPYPGSVYSPVLAIRPLDDGSFVLDDLGLCWAWIVRGGMLKTLGLERVVDVQSRVLSDHPHVRAAEIDGKRVLATRCWISHDNTNMGWWQVNTLLSAIMGICWPLHVMGGSKEK